MTPNRQATPQPKSLTTRLIHSPTLWLALAALTLRLLYLEGFVAWRGMSALAELTVDMQTYYKAALQIGRHFNFSDFGITTFGPGYPAFAALTSWPFSFHPLAVLLTQIVLSTVTTLLVVRLGILITGHRRLSFLAGWIFALSPMGVILATMYWSETWFMFLLVSGLTAYLKAEQTQRFGWSLLAGVVLGVAVLTRSVGMLLPLVLLVWAGARNWQGSLRAPSLWRAFRFAIVSSLFVSIVVGGWLVRNVTYQDLPGLALANPHGLAKVSAQVLSEANATTYDEAAQSLFRMKEAYCKSHQLSYNRGFTTYYQCAFFKIAWDHPLQAAGVLADNAWHHQTIESAPGILPVKVRSGWRPLEWLLHLSWMRFRWSVAVLLGLILLFVQRQWRAAIMIATVSLYFGLTSSFVVNQGARIVYPASVVDSLAVAVVILTVVSWLANRIRGDR